MLWNPWGYITDGLKHITFYVQKPIPPPALVRDKPPGAPAFVKLVYHVLIFIPVVQMYLINGPVHGKSELVQVMAVNGDHLNSMVGYLYSSDINGHQGDMPSSEYTTGLRLWKYEWRQKR